MSGKGDKRRPRNIGDAEFEAAWDRVFRKPADNEAIEAYIAEAIHRGSTDEQIDAVLQNSFGTSLEEYLDHD